MKISLYVTIDGEPASVAAKSVTAQLERADLEVKRLEVQEDGLRFRLRGGNYGMYRIAFQLENQPDGIARTQVLNIFSDNWWNVIHAEYDIHFRQRGEQWEAMAHVRYERTLSNGKYERNQCSNNTALQQKEEAVLLTF